MLPPDGACYSGYARAGTLTRYLSDRGFVQEGRQVISARRGEAVLAPAPPAPARSVMRKAPALILLFGMH